MFTLSRNVPARKKTLHAEWIKKDFMEMSPEYRAIRVGARNKLCSCHWCGHDFSDGDMMALAHFVEHAGNKTLCQTCANAFVES